MVDDNTAPPMATEDTTSDVEAPPLPPSTNYNNNETTQEITTSSNNSTISSEKEKIDTKTAPSTPTASSDEPSSNDKLSDSLSSTNTEQQERLVSREDEANCLSSWLLLYLTPLLKLGATKVLSGNDVGPPSKCDKAASCYNKVQSLWIAEVERTKQLNELNKTKHQQKLAIISDALPNP